MPSQSSAHKKTSLSPSWAQRRLRGVGTSKKGYLDAMVEACSKQVKIRTRGKKYAMILRGLEHQTTDYTVQLDLIEDDEGVEDGLKAETYDKRDDMYLHSIYAFYSAKSLGRKRHLLEALRQSLGYSVDIFDIALPLSVVDQYAAALQDDHEFAAQFGGYDVSQGAEIEPREHRK